jgi:hypothetical protein
LNSFWYIMWYMVFSSRTVPVPNTKVVFKKCGLKLVDGEGKLGVERNEVLYELALIPMWHSDYKSSVIYILVSTK